jgi:hypothetical protein
MKAYPMELTEIDIKNSSSAELFEYIKWKGEYPDEGENAFREFCLRFDTYVVKTAEIACHKWGYNETIALVIAECVFNKVWKYPSYNHEKSKASTEKKGIKLWLSRIIYTQLATYRKSEECYHEEEGDLSLIYSIDELVEKTTEYPFKQKQLETQLQIVDEALDKLTLKHKVVYLTYMLYAPDSKKNIPRSISKMLQENLDLTAGSIRKYKQEAKKIVESFIRQTNGTEE